MFGHIPIMYRINFPSLYDTVYCIINGRINEPDHSHYYPNPKHFWYYALYFSKVIIFTNTVYLDCSYNKEGYWQVVSLGGHKSCADVILFNIPK